MGQTIRDILIGAMGSLLAVGIASYFGASQRLLQRVWGAPFLISRIISRGGITRMTLTRDDYHAYPAGAGGLRTYLALAERSIDMVSISMNITQAEADIISLFREKVQQNQTFRVRITLLHPESAVVPLLEKSLALEEGELRAEIEDTLGKLIQCKRALPRAARDRLGIYVHRTLPIGSAILSDATPDRGRIQVETKLYRAPRTESFGFEVQGPSEFYARNFKAWVGVFDDSEGWEEPQS